MVRSNWKERNFQSLPGSDRNYPTESTYNERFQQFPIECRVKLVTTKCPFRETLDDFRVSDVHLRLVSTRSAKMLGANASARYSSSFTWEKEFGHERANVCSSTLEFSSLCAFRDMQMFVTNGRVFARTYRSLWRWTGRFAKQRKSDLPVPRRSWRGASRNAETCWLYFGTAGRRCESFFLNEVSRQSIYFLRDNLKRRSIYLDRESDSLEAKGES